MKNSIWIWIAAIILIIIVLFSFGGKKASSDLSEDKTETQKESEILVKNETAKKPLVPAKPVEGMKVSLGGIFDAQGNYQCDYEQVSQTSRSSSVIYASNGRLRGEFRTMTGDKGTATIVVYNNPYLYVWTEGQSKGTVTQPKTISELPGLIPEDVTSGRILGSGINNVSWNCHAWSKDESKLVKPSYVQFN